MTHSKLLTLFHARERPYSSIELWHRFYIIGSNKRKLSQSQPIEWTFYEQNGSTWEPGLATPVMCLAYFEARRLKVCRDGRQSRSKILRRIFISLQKLFGPLRLSLKPQSKLKKFFSVIWAAFRSSVILKISSLSAGKILYADQNNAVLKWG